MFRASQHKVCDLKIRTKADRLRIGELGATTRRNKNISLVPLKFTKKEKK
jgi:hypothetical protein